MNHEEAQRLWRDPHSWKLWLLYVRREDPRVVVRQRSGLGYTFNFAHPWAFPALGILLGIITVPVLYWASRGELPWQRLVLLLVCAISGAVIWAHWVASGPRGEAETKD